MGLVSRRIMSLFPIYNSGAAISHIAGSILGEMARRGATVQLWVPASDRGFRRPFIRDAVPSLLKGLAYRVAGAAGVRALAEHRFLRSLRPGDLVYVWPGYGIDLCRRIKDRGGVLVLERINCHTAVAKAILDREAASAGVPPSHGITDATIAHERIDLGLADFVFSPSPMVDASLLSEGVPAEKILPCSYGWSPERISVTGVGERQVGAAGSLSVLFVGLICLRKGVHRLLEAWKQADVPGELVLAGRLTDEFAAHYESYLNRPDVRLLGHVSDIGRIYQTADVFAFPSFEEGDPLVTYEAMSAGLPVMVSPMGAGRIAQGGNGGAVVIPPDEPETWAEAFRRLAADPALRAKMGRQAAVRAAEFTWDKCAAVRLDRLAGAVATCNC